MPKNNKKVRAQSRRMLKIAEQEYSKHIANKLGIDAANTEMVKIKIESLMEDVGNKAMPYMKLEVGVMEQGREALEVCACPLRFATFINR